ncbi:MAG: HTH domain-containing protein [archaeon]|nr:HTH domain-containing protein [archaeon]
MYKCKFCGKTFEKLRVFNQHLSISHKDKWNEILDEWWIKTQKGTPAREIAEEYKVNILTVYKYIKKIKKSKGLL